jgi:hypothetical protein
VILTGEIEIREAVQPAAKVHLQWNVEFAITRQELRCREIAPMRLIGDSRTLYEVEHRHIDCQRDRLQCVDGSETAIHLAGSNCLLHRVLCGAMMVENERDLGPVVGRQSAVVELRPRSRRLKARRQ